MNTYLDHYRYDPVHGWRCIHSWAEHTAERLAWAHGQERAAAIMAGDDPETRKDIAAFATLGARLPTGTYRELYSAVRKSDGIVSP